MLEGVPPAPPLDSGVAQALCCCLTALPPCFDIFSSSSLVVLSLSSLPSAGSYFPSLVISVNSEHRRFASEKRMVSNLTYESSTGLWTSTHTEYKQDRDSDVMYAYWVAALFHVSSPFCPFRSVRNVTIHGISSTNGIEFDQSFSLIFNKKQQKQPFCGSISETFRTISFNLKNIFEN